MWTNSSHFDSVTKLNIAMNLFALFTFIFLHILFILVDSKYNDLYILFNSFKSQLNEIQIDRITNSTNSLQSLYNETTNSTIVLDLINNNSTALTNNTISIYNISKLFHTFSFKGFGLSFVKSTKDKYAFGIGLRIPITPNFPDYDRVAYLPRVNSLLGFAYPYCLRVSISISIPLQYAVYGLMNCFGKKYFTSSDDLLYKLQNPKPTDVTRRLGMSLSLKYSIDGSVTPSIGAWVLLIPGRQHVDYFYNGLFISAASVISLINLFTDLNITDFSPLVAPSIEKVQNSSSVDLLHDNSTISNTNKSTHSKLIKRKSKSKYKKLLIHRHGVMFWKDWIQNTIKRSGKVLNVLYSASWMQTHRDAFMGSNFNFDISNFFPFNDTIHTIFQNIKSKRKIEKNKKLKMKNLVTNELVVVSS